MGKRITIQDIADSLGVSRNTVSKALNNTGVLADATRDRILQKAAELGYKKFSYYPPLDSIPKPENCEIALFTRSMPNSSHFGSKLLNTFQEKISSKGYRLSFFLVREQEFAELQLPAGFDLSNTAGIICLELFDYAYSQMLSRLDIPLLFADCAANNDFTMLDADFLFMENRSSISNVVQTLIKNGQHRLAFVGNTNHCQSFFERYQGFCDALRLADLKPVTDALLTDKSVRTVDQLASHLRQVKELPDVFVCANDFVAIDLIEALKQCGLSVPKDVRITGFDNSAESRIIEPHLTTVHIPSTAMGYIAAELLLSRIEEPGIPYRTTYVRTVIKYRESSCHQS